MTRLKLMMLPVLALAITLNSQAAATAADPQYNVVCYFASWAVYRQDNGKYDVEDIDPDLCTHHIYTFAGLGSDHKIYSLDPYRDLEDDWGNGGYLRFTGMKARSPQIKTMLSIGGWNEGSENYSNMCESSENRATFVSSAVDFLEKYNFDGLDFDWEYPTQREGGKPEDKENFSLLMKELGEALHPRGLLLSAAIAGARQTTDQAYNVVDVAKYVDFMNILSYDYHGTWDNFIDHDSPLYLSQKDVERGEPFSWFSVNYTMQYFLGMGIAPAKLMMGFPLYGHGFTLSDPAKHAPYDSNEGPMNECPYTLEAGFCGYNELCERIFSDSGWTDVMDPEMKAVYSYKDSTWIGWENQETVQYKLDYLKSIGVGGAMLWSIDTDDFRGLCGGDKYPITSQIWTQLNG